MRARRGDRGKRESARGRRGGVLDRRLAAVAAVATVCLLAIARAAVDPTGPAGWSWPVLMLCVLVAAGAGRALTGHRDDVQDAAQPPPRRVKAAIWVLLLVAAVGPNLHGLGVGFLADDFGLLRAARLMDSPLDAGRLVPLGFFYRPVALLVWWLGLQLWHGSALGYHLFSLLLHGANTALVYLLARRYLGTVFGGATAAMLFALHPVHVEATVWAAAQPDLLCTLFCLSCMLCVENYLSGRNATKPLALAGALVLFLLALWSKETAAALVGVVAIRLAALPRGRRAAGAVRIGPAFTLALLVYLAIRFLVLREQWLGSEEIRAGAWTGTSLSMPLLLMCQLLLPVHQALLESVVSRAAVVGVMAIGLLWWMRRLELVSWSRSAIAAGYLLMPALPVAAAGLAIGSDMANSRYAYLPSVGLALLFGGLCAAPGDGGRRRALAGASVIAFAAALSTWYVLPWRQAAQLRDRVLDEGRRLVQQLPASPSPPTLYLQGLPDTHRGVPVFICCYSMALTPLVDREVRVIEVASTPTAREMMDASDLLPGEHLANWDSKRRRVMLKRSGPTAPPAPEAHR
ncbi:MAG: ArnT family glycosyltransferase [Armatimonadota bacterium]